MREARARTIILNAVGDTLDELHLNRAVAPTDAILTALSSAGIDCEGWRTIESAPFRRGKVYHGRDQAAQRPLGDDCTVELAVECASLREQLGLAIVRAERAEARLSGFHLVYVHGLRTLVPENLLPLVQALLARAEDAERQLRDVRNNAQAACL